MTTKPTSFHLTDFDGFTHRRVLPTVFLFVSFVMVPVTDVASSFGQDAAEAKSKLNARYMPDDAVVGAIASFDEVLQSPSLSLFPMEVVRVQTKETMGFDLMDLREIRVAVSLNPENLQPRFGMMAKITGPVDLQLLAKAMGGGGTPVMLSGIRGYEAGGPPGTLLTRVDDETLFLGMVDYLPEMRDASGASGKLPELIASMPQRQGLTVAVAMEQIRPMASGLAMQQSSELPPDFQPLARIPAMTDAIKLHAFFDGQAAGVKLAVVGISETEAERIERILLDALQSGRRIGFAAITRQLQQGDQSAEMRTAIQQYARRMVEKVAGDLAPNRNGDHVSIAMQSNAGIASTGVLASLLLPAIQAAREAARRMSSSNNMKEIMLAMHNHHAAYRELPMTAIVDDQGKPLLSWRVKILPFIEEQGLYEQFHLDEPWDSPHNLPLSRELPEVYQSPGKNLPPGMTTFQVAVGDGLAFTPLKPNRFPEYLDGLSNTVMLLETNDDQAVIWSKPEDLAIDMNNPLRGLGEARPNGFHVGLADGAIVFLTKEVDPDLFKKILTRAGREIINEPLGQ